MDDIQDKRMKRTTSRHVDRDLSQPVGTTSTETRQEPDVDIRRTMIMGRGVDAYGRNVVSAAVPSVRTLHWGPIFAGLMTSLVTSLLLGSLFLGLGFDRSYGVFGGLNSGHVSIGAGIAMVIGVFAGGYLAGYVSDLSTKAESVLNGFMTGVMAIITPLVVAVFGAFSLANTATLAAAQTMPRTGVGHAAATAGPSAANAVPPDVAANVQTNLAIAASNAWQVFLVGIIVLALGAVGGYLGRLNREKAMELQARADVTGT